MVKKQKICNFEFGLFLVLLIEQLKTWDGKRMRDRGSDPQQRAPGRDFGNISNNCADLIIGKFLYTTKFNILLCWIKAIISGTLSNYFIYDISILSPSGKIHNSYHKSKTGSKHAVVPLGMT